MTEGLQLQPTAAQVGGLLAVVRYALEDQAGYLFSRIARLDHGAGFPSDARMIAGQFSNFASVLRQFVTADARQGAQCDGFAEGLRRLAERTEAGPEP